MLQSNTQNNPILQSDIIALDALFKRIAERGRMIRIQNKTADNENPNKKTVPVEPTSALLEEQVQKK